MPDPPAGRTRVAVTLRRSDATAYDEPRDALARDWIPLFEAQGICPILIPSALSNPVALATELGAEGLLLTGGESMGEDPLRDGTERRLLDWALDHSLPTVGVCRGLHSIHTFLGGDLDAVESREAHVACQHALVLEPRLSAPLGGEAAPVVNSYHGYRIRGEPRELRVLGAAPDGAIELVEHVTAPLRAAQFHPERPGCDPRLVDWLFEELRAA